VGALFAAALLGGATFSAGARASLTQPGLTPIQADFNSLTYTTTYTENATAPGGQALSYAWALSFPADPACTVGFHANTPQPNQSQWYHEDTSSGGICNHTGTTYDAAGRGHPGTVFVVVSNADWNCTASYFGTQGDAGSPTGVGSAPAPCQPKHPPTAADVKVTSHPVDPKSGRAVVEFSFFTDDEFQFDLIDTLLYFLGGQVAQSPDQKFASPIAGTAKAAKKAGTVANASKPAGQATLETTLKLNGKGKKALRQKGKVKVTVKGTVKNSAGSTTFSRKLKLVAKKK
jgi:hypothetical protein